MTKKVICNHCFGGFGLSHEGEDLYAKKSGFELFRYKRNGNYDSNEYVKVKTPNKDDWSIMTFNQDHGDTFEYDSTKEQGYWYHGDLERDDTALVAVVEELGAKANGRFSELEVVEIPDDVKWEVYEYDGFETVERPRQEY